MSNEATAAEDRAKPKEPCKVWFVGPDNYERLRKIRRRFQREFGLTQMPYAEVANKVIDHYLFDYPLGPEDE